MVDDFITSLEDCLKKFDNYTKDPVKFLGLQENLEENVKLLLKQLYNLMKANENVNLKSNETLSSLLIENFDFEQIWQQINLHNCSKNSKIEEFMSSRKEVPFSLSSAINDYGVDNDDVDDSNDDNTDDDDDGDDNNPDDSSDDNSDNNYKSSGSDSDSRDTKNDDRAEIDPNDMNSAAQKGCGTRSVVDDKFFKLAEMEKFLLNAEKDIKIDTSSSYDESKLIGYFEEIPSSDEESDKDRPMYSDFFETPLNTSEKNDIAKKSQKNVRFFSEDNIRSENKGEEDIENGLDEEYSDEEKIKSTYEERKDRIDKHVKKLEEEIISEKPWQMKGEITAKKRPQNSLLEEALEFDVSTRPAPVMTEDVMIKLEDIILRRIKDKAWDDVEKKIKPVDTPFEFKKKLILNQEKSKESLAQIYEKEYIKQREEKNPVNKNSVLEEPKEHQKLRQLTNLLFRKLDALSNYHFTPMPIAPKLDIIDNMPAITMEEVAPITVSDATILAPEEIQAKQKGSLISKEERTKTDMKRDRRKKKLRQRIKKIEIEKRQEVLNKLNVGKGNKYNTEKIRKELDQLAKSNKVLKLGQTTDSKAITSSKSFFSALQNQISDQVPNNKRKNNNKSFVTKKVKL